MRVRLFCLLILAFLYIAIPSSVLSQDIQTIFTPSSERVVLFVDHQSSRVKVIIEPNFGTYDNYSFDAIDLFDLQWIIPIPAPAIEEADAVFSLPNSIPSLRAELNQLDNLTQVRFEPDVPRYCYDTFEYEGRSGDASYPVDLIAQATDYTVVSNNDLDTILNQLRTEGYNISGNDLPRLQEYAEAGLSFLAVRYQLDAQEDSGAGEYTLYGSPLTFSFPWSDSSIPLTFSSPAYGSTTWIFDDWGYNSVNIPHISPDYNQLYAPHSIVNTGNFTYYKTVDNHYPTLSIKSYQQVLQGILADGAVVTELAGTVDVFPSLDVFDILKWMIDDYSYISRFTVRTGDTSIYPIYELSPEQHDISNVIDLNTYSDPLTYWGCSTRTALDESTRANLPSERRRFDDLRFAVAYPPDWHLSILTMDDETIYGLSPELLTLDAVSAAINGDSAQPPMFVFSEYTYVTDGYAGPLLTNQNLFTQLNIEMWTAASFRNLAVRFDMNQMEMQQEHGVMYGIITNDDDWAANEAMYKAMLAYAQSYQYFSSTDWAHTLFINSNPLEDTGINLEIPYPDGWIEHVDVDEIVISEEMTEFRLIPISKATPDWIEQQYNLTNDLPCGQLTQFQANGREGYVFHTNGYLAETSTSTGEIAEYESIFLKMMIVLPDTCSR